MKRNRERERVCACVCFCFQSSWQHLGVASREETRRKVAKARKQLKLVISTRIDIVFPAPPVLPYLAPCAQSPHRLSLFLPFFLVGPLCFANCSSCFCLRNK